jgi:hypothetical protein
MNVKSIYLICILSFSIQNVFAQKNSNISTALYLEDGSIYIGEIVSEDAFEIVLKTEFIGEVTVPAYLVKNRSNKGIIVPNTIAKYHKTTGNFFTFDYTFNFGDNNLSQLNFIFGKRLKPNLNLGIGMAYTYMATNSRVRFIDQQLLQTYVYGQYFFNDKKWRLFVDAKMGYGFDISGTDNFGFGDIRNTGGVYFNPGIGFQLANRKNMKWSFKLSQHIQKATTTDFFQDNLQNPVSINSNVWYNRTTFTVGINF